MLIDAYSLLFLLAFGLLVIIALTIFAQRQIFRIRDNNVRRDPSITIGSGLSKAHREEIMQELEKVRQFRLLSAPKFTDISTIGQHANAPYVNRMIALDELREIGRQLEFINVDLARLAGESMYAYLSRLQRIALPTLPTKVVERVGFLAEHARYRHEPFGEKELAEVRQNIKDIMKILNSELERLSCLQVNNSDNNALSKSASSNRTPKRRWFFGRDSTRQRRKNLNYMSEGNTEESSSFRYFQNKHHPSDLYQQNVSSVDECIPLLEVSSSSKAFGNGDSSHKTSTSEAQPSGTRSGCHAENAPLITNDELDEPVVA